MCGIAGIINLSAAVNPSDLSVVRDSLTHRGPDSCGSWISADGMVGLAHRRLAVIDLTSAGYQPMAGQGQNLQLTFNGEIYNYKELKALLESRGIRFRSQSDTEVVLESYQRWGVECLAHLNGMFAFALWDEQKRSLFVARDRAGEKPLYYWHDGGLLVFASELKAIMAYPGHGRRLDRESLNFYLSRGYVPGSRCILQGVKKLAPGHYLMFDAGANRMHVRQYWQPPVPHSVRSDADEPVLLDECESLLTNAVARQLVADVPVGVLLSGGIDSSIITALAARANSSPIKTFTITFPGHSKYNEATHAAAVAHLCSTDHTELAAGPPSIQSLGEIVQQYDEPLGDASLIPTVLVSHLVRRHVTVALGGDGADELFGGYVRYNRLVSQSELRRSLPVPWPLVAPLVGMLPVGLPGRAYMLGLSAPPRLALGLSNAYFDPWARRRLLNPEVLHQIGEGLNAPEVSADHTFASNEIAQGAMREDFQSYLPDDILVKVDRASMLCSLEVRAPFLDYRLVEFAYRSVPTSLKVNKQERKILLKRLLARLLPGLKPRNDKQGFSIPLGAWLRNGSVRGFNDVLADACPELFRRPTVRKLVVGQSRGMSNHYRLFALVMFELWRRHYRVVV